ncbi:MAG: hypothetical protein ACJA1T_001375 [Zhongshania aliphaticivorans]|jgi:hypothetical protein|tara:strand:- start:64 stop:213 length:150 start_codon:yes stop_codon:yes gene_type:complete
MTSDKQGIKEALANWPHQHYNARCFSGVHATARNQTTAAELIGVTKFTI